MVPPAVAMTFSDNSRSPHELNVTNFEGKPSPTLRRAAVLPGNTTANTLHPAVTSTRHSAAALTSSFFPLSFFPFSLPPASASGAAAGSAGGGAGGSQNSASSVRTKGAVMRLPAMMSLCGAHCPMAPSRRSAVTSTVGVAALKGDVVGGATAWNASRLPADARTGIMINLRFWDNTTDEAQAALASTVAWRPCRGRRWA